MTTPRDNALYANMSKSQFGVDEVEHLGHRVSAAGIMPAANRLQAMTSWPTPTTHAELRTFIGHVTYLARFIRDFATIVKPLNSIRNGSPGSGGHQPVSTSLWSTACQQAFDRLRTAVTTAPVLRPPDFDQPFFVQYDASKVAIAAALLQRSSGLLLPVAYTSRALTPPETRWPIYDLEFNALVHATRSFRPYLLHPAHRWVALGDHKPLTHFTTQAILGLRQLRQLDHLAMYDFEFRYLSGSKLTYAGPLSRPPGVTIDYHRVQPTFAESDCTECAAQPCGHAAGQKLEGNLVRGSEEPSSEAGTECEKTPRHLDPRTSPEMRGSVRGSGNGWEGGESRLEHRGLWRFVEAFLASGSFWRLSGDLQRLPGGIRRRWRPRNATS